MACQGEGGSLRLRQSRKATATVMADVTIYTTPSCPYCVRAKSLLKQKGIPYREIDVSGDEARREKMVAESGRRTVPQIFIDGKPIGGFTELAALAESGELDGLVTTE